MHDEYLKNNEKVKLIEALELDNQHLKDQLALLKDDIYGTSSEQSISPKVDIEEPNPLTNLVTPDFTNQDKAQRSAPSNAGLCFSRRLELLSATLYGLIEINDACFNGLKQSMLSFFSLFKLPIELIDMFLLFVF